MPFAAINKKKVKNTDPFALEPIQRQIENTKLRIRDSGLQPNDDSRNWFEKATNLPKKQNTFLDILEIINRPTAGVMNVLDKRDTSTKPLEAFAKGVSGKERISGVDIAKKRGVKGKAAQFVSGTALEILADPLNILPVGIVAKGIGAAGKGVGKGFNAAENVIPQLGAARTAKDALGKMFVPQYGWEKTLTGEADDTLKKLYRGTERDIRVQKDKSLTEIADIAKGTGVDAGADVGRIMESELKSFDEAGKPIPRPIREISTNEEVQSAAKSLMRSNQLLRQYALDNGINIKEMEGYMTHVLSAEERKLRKSTKAISVDRGNFGVGQPNKKILNTRKLEGTVEDVNEQMGRKLFEPNAYFATGIGQRRLIEYVNSVKFRREVLSNPSFAVPYNKGDVVPNGATIIDVNDYKFAKDDVLDELGLPDEIGGQYIVTNGVKESLDRYKKLTTDEGVNAFLKTFDAAQTVWKRAALFSIPYHLRNDIGAKFNNWVAGMNAAELTKYSAEADADVFNAVFRRQPSELYQEYTNQGLSSTALSQVEFRPFSEPEEAIKKTITERSKDLKGNVLTRLNPLRAFETSREFGDFVDQTNRFALYKWAREKKNMNPEQATEMVNRVQFDYTNNTVMEREVLTRAIPFYRWMRNNIPYQLRQFAENPVKYARINKIRINAQEAAGIDDENTPQWMKEQFAIAVKGDGKGSGKFLSMGLPVGDLLKVTNPLKTAVDSLTPLIKTPIELQQNRNFFYKKPIEKFAGQEKQFQIPGTDINFGIPVKAAYLGEQATGQIGRGLSQYLQRQEDADQDLKFRKPSMGINSVIKDFDAKKARYYELLDELNKLQDQIDYIEQQTGQRPRTTRDIR